MVRCVCVCVCVRACVRARTHECLCMRAMYACSDKLRIGQPLSDEIVCKRQPEENTMRKKKRAYDTLQITKANKGSSALTVCIGALKYNSALSGFTKAILSFTPPQC